MWRSLRFPLLLAFTLLSFGVVWIVSRSIEWQRVPIEDVLSQAGATVGNGREQEPEESVDQNGNGAPAVAVTTGPRSPSGRGKATVVWISVDGFMGDYLDRGVSPELNRFRREALYTYRLRPPFPSLTFPAHVTKATGVPVSGHGIPANRYFDRELGQMLSFPGDADLLRAEPIWLTATRQGIRVAVHDWPLSHNQTGDVRTAYYGERFDGALSDRQRLDQLLATWQADRDSVPLRLLMGYTKAVDSAGHRYGPDGRGMLPVIEQLDGELGDFTRRVKSQFDKIRRIGDELFIIFSADHGMMRVDTNINLRMALGPALSAQLETATGGNVANLYLKPQANDSGRAVDERKERILSQIESRLQETLPYAEVFRADATPPHWGYRDPSRVGDMIVVLPPGYTFNASDADIASDAQESGGLLGMHGWAVEDAPEMEGLLMILRYPTPFPQSRDLGPVDMRQLHPTVARLLGIQPAPGADAPPLTL